MHRVPPTTSVLMVLESGVGDKEYTENDCGFIFCVRCLYIPAPECHTMNEYPLSDNLRQRLILGVIEVMESNDENSPNSQVEHGFEVDGRTIVASIKISEVPKVKAYRNRDWLYEEYTTKGRTMQDIADQFNITPMSIHQWLKKLDIDTRPRGRFKTE